jgi:membrane protease YdiL (CAAX protease family)
MIWSIPLFLDAFNDEFLFRGVFFLFAYKNTENLPLAYIVSMMIAFAWHPLTPFRMVPVFVQGTLLCYLLYKSKNIHGAWISHGINRTSGSVVALGRGAVVDGIVKDKRKTKLGQISLAGKTGCHFFLKTIRCMR